MNRYEKLVSSEKKSVVIEVYNFEITDTLGRVHVVSYKQKVENALQGSSIEPDYFDLYDPRTVDGEYIMQQHIVSHRKLETKKETIHYNETKTESLYVKDNGKISHTETNIKRVRI